MKFPAPLTKARLIKRYKRFLCDFETETGDIQTAACPNTGAMLGLTGPGSAIWLSRSDNPKRKYKHTWELVQPDDPGEQNTIVGINPNHPNRLGEEAINGGHIVELSGYETLRREVKYGQSSRVDILLEHPNKPPCYVEIKNVHFLRNGGLAEFPDSRTERGVKHLRELAAMVREGARAVMLYIIQRSDVDRLSFAGDIDASYAEAFKESHAAGVEALAYSCLVSPAEIIVDKRVPIVGVDG